ncbi:MAG: IPTL-CTERM sorting domain-containing protein [Halothiobacillaceae bacterium]
MTHFNRPISSGTGLEHIEMEWNLALFANQTDANNAETSNNANAIVEIQNSYTIYNWETANAGYGINGYYYSTDGGATWTGNTAAGSCPNSRSDGTLVSPVNNPGPEQIFIANGTDSPGDDCSDAHAFVRQAFVDTTFTYDDGGGERTYSAILTGFHHNGNGGSNTFWAGEEAATSGTVSFQILDVTPEIDLGITKSVTPEPVVSGENVTYAITVTNNDDTDTAANVVVEDTLPTGFNFVSAAGGGFICSETGGTVSCLLSTLAAGESATLNVIATAAVPGGTGPHTNTATVSSDADDNTPGNDTATADSNVIAADLGVTKSDSNDPVNAGDSFDYQITVTNGGTADAANVVLTDTLPAGVTYSSDDSGCSHAAGIVTCNLGALAVGASTSVTITVQADATAVDRTVTNTVSVTTDTTENPDDLPNTTTEDTQILGTPVPPPEVYQIPTLSQWALILMSLLIGGFGWLAVRRRDDHFSA